MSENKPKKHYLPPDKDAIEEYARRFCESANASDPEIIDGFSAFMNSVAQAYTNYLNETEKGNKNE